MIFKISLFHESFIELLGFLGSFMTRKGISVRFGVDPD